MSVATLPRRGKISVEVTEQMPKVSTVVISFRVAKRTKQILQADVDEIIRKLDIKGRFTLSEYHAIILSHAREKIKQDILSGKIIIADI